MAYSVCVSEWDNYGWGAYGGNAGSITVNDTFTVASIDRTNCVMWLTPYSLKVTEWPNETYWAPTGEDLPFSAGQTLTVTSVDLNNRIAYLSG